MDNNPIVYSDPSGHFKDDKELAKYLRFNSVEEMWKSSLWKRFSEAGILDLIRSGDFDFGNLISIEYDNGQVKNFLLSQGCLNNCSEQDLILYDVDSGEAFSGYAGYDTVFANVKSGALFSPTSNKYDTFTFLKGNANLPEPKLKENWMNGKDGDISLHVKWNTETKVGGALTTISGGALIFTWIAEPPVGLALTVAYALEAIGVIGGGAIVLNGPKTPEFRYR